MLRSIIAVLVASSLLALAGCRNSPVMNVVDAPIAAGRTLQQVEQAIQQAGVSLGWQMRPEGPGRMSGALIRRDHRAMVDIAYSPRSYSIHYKDSTNLHYDGTNIHNNYNGWIENLDRAIRVRLAG